jgi:RNA polymerase sigma-70 factor (ECF subfamily)
LDGREAQLKALMDDAQRGDAAAYARLLTTLATYLRAFFRRRLSRDPDSVEDLVQETLLAIHNQRHTYEAGALFTPWLHAIARYKLIDHLRRGAARREEPLPAEDHSAVLEDEAAEAPTARRDVLKLLATLPAHFRLPIEHVKLEGLSIEEAAVRTGMSISAVKIGIHRGMKALARGLQAIGNAHG